MPPGMPTDIRNPRNAPARDGCAGNGLSLWRLECGPAQKQLPFFGIGKWNTDAAVTVFDNSVGNVCLQGVFHSRQ